MVRRATFFFKLNKNKFKLGSENHREWKLIISLFNFYKGLQLPTLLTKSEREKFKTLQPKRGRAQYNFIKIKLRLEKQSMCLESQ